MGKTLDQIILDGQAAQCSSLEELYVLWELAQQMEAAQGACTETCCETVSPMNFHVDGVFSETDFNGVLYLLKEPNLKKYLSDGGADSSLPLVTDLRPKILREGRRREPAFEYLVGMQRILCAKWGKEENKADEQKEQDERNKQSEQEKGLENKSGSEILKTAALVYINKRGGLDHADERYLNYGRYYIEFLRRQLRFIRPRIMICGGEEIFKLVVKEVFCNKKKVRNKGEHMVWKNYVDGNLFHADYDFKPVRQPVPRGVTVLNMWSPAYRVNSGLYISREEYLKEFARRVEKIPLK